MSAPTALARTSFAFGGGLYAWPYHAGVASYLQDHQLVGDDARLYGVSSGNVPAALLACGVSITQVGLFAAMRSNDAHAQGALGPWFNPSGVRASFDLFARALPEDAHERASGRLFVVVTEVPSMRKRVLSQFKSRDSLLDALTASMSIPGHSVPIAYRAHHLDRRLFLDGGLVANVIDDNRPGYRTIRIGVFNFQSMLFPRPRKLHIEPGVRVPWSMRLSVASDDERRAWHARGYADARRYFEHAPVRRPLRR